MPDKDKLLSAIDAAEEGAYGSDSSGVLSSDREYSIRLYMGENTHPAPTGRSQVVDRSVFETIQWILPSLCRIFANGSDLVSVPPIGPDDEESAKQEAEYLNWVMTQQNPWFETFLIWATDAMMTRNSYAMAYADKQRITEVERYERQTEEGLALLLEDKGVEIVEARSYPSEAPPQPALNPDGSPAVDEMGQPVMLPPENLYDIELRRVREKNKICVRVLPPERCKVSQFTPSYRLRDCDYFEYWDFKTISDLRAEGFEIEDDIASDDTDTQEDSARDIYNENRQDDITHDPAMRRVKVRMVWIKHDYDEDGIAELQYVVRVGREILYREEVSTIPVACMVPSPLPHRHMGISITDMVEDIQLIKTTILRQGLDNLYLANNPQKVINRHMVNLDDVLISVPGGVIRTDDVNAVRYEVAPFVFNHAMEGLEYMDQIRENRTGTNRYFTGLDQNAINKTARGIEKLTTMAAQRVEQIARIMGSGVEDLARIVHELILKSGHKDEVVKIRGNWVQVDPAAWRKRTDFKIAVGFAAGDKDSLVARLQMISMSQFQALQMGLPIVKPENIYSTMLELAKASDFATPERFWSDPNLEQPQPQPPDPDMMKLQADSTAKQAELELQQESKGADIQLREQEMSQKFAMEKYKTDKQAETQIILAQINRESGLEMESHKSALGKEKFDKVKVENLDKLDKAVDSMESLAESSAQQSAVMADVMQKMAEVMQSMSEAMTAEKRVIRDKSGKVVGVKAVNGE